MITLLVSGPSDQQLKTLTHPLSKDRILCSNRNVDQPLRRRLLYIRESPPIQAHTAPLIRAVAVRRLAQHLHIRHLLFLDGPLYVQLGGVRIESCSPCASILQLVARGTQRAPGDP